MKRQFLHDDATAFGEQSPRRNPAAVFLVGADDLVTRSQVQSVGEEIHPHGGVLRQGDLWYGRIDESSSRGTNGIEPLIAGQRLAVRLLIGPRREFRLKAPDALRQRLHDLAGRGSERPRIAIGNPRGDQELTPRLRKDGGVIRLCIGIEPAFARARRASGETRESASTAGLAPMSRPGTARLEMKRRLECAIGRSLLSPLSRAELVRVRPPLKPSVFLMTMKWQAAWRSASGKRTGGVL